MPNMIKDFVSVDLETTGVLLKEDRIIEIAAVRYRNGVETDFFHSYLDPERALPERITELTGITQQMLAGQPTFGDVSDELSGFLGEDILMAHHVSFDYAFLKRGFVSLSRENRIPFERKGIDTLKIARQCLPELESRSLSSLCEYYGIPICAHRALEDARATAKLYFAMAEEFKAGKETIFAPYPLIYKIKKESPATKRQKELLYRLLKQHKIEPEYSVEGLTKNEASRYTDRILSEYGRSDFS